MITLKDAVPLHLLGPVSAVLLVLLAGCAGVPTEVRYNENTLSYTSLPAGITSTSARDEAVTARYRVGKNEGATTYMSLPSGVQSRSGRLDGVTAYYTLRDGHSSTSSGAAVQTSSAEQAAADYLAAGKAGSDQPIVLAISDVLFDFDKWDIKESFFSELNKWAEFFLANPQVHAEVYGHTDSIGGADYNQRLSEKRAQAVKDYLVKKGIDAGRL